MIIGVFLVKSNVVVKSPLFIAIALNFLKVSPVVTLLVGEELNVAVPVH
jgi:hypothetical protein